MVKAKDRRGEPLPRYCRDLKELGVRYFGLVMCEGVIYKCELTSSYVKSFHQ